MCPMFHVALLVLLGVRLVVMFGVALYDVLYFVLRVLCIVLNVTCNVLSCRDVSPCVMCGVAFRCVALH